jgi:hypothetical protein
MSRLKPPQTFTRFGLLVLFATTLPCGGSGAVRAQSSQDARTAQDELPEADKANYVEALAYCRRNVPRPIALREDKKVACLDGEIRVDLDLSSVEGLKTGGLFVVRNPNGETVTTAKLADLLLNKQATVIINDYCLANCANYIFVASLKTFVPKGALVAWHYVGEHRECIVLSETSDHGAPRFDAGACRGGFHDNGRNEYIDQLRRKFYENRAPSFAMPPESVVVRKALKGRLDATGAVPAVYWTWNPRYYASAIRTKVFYEAYPQNQDEVDAIAARIGVGVPVIYDP